MKVIVTTRSDKEQERRDYRSALEIKVKTKAGEKHKLSFSDGEPEDSNMSRDFCDVYNIPELLRVAYKAGKAGEKFEVQLLESNDI